VSQELSPNLGDGLRDQAAAVWDCEDAGLAATSIPSVNPVPDHAAQASGGLQIDMLGEEFGNLGLAEMPVVGAAFLLAVGLNPERCCQWLIVCPSVLDIAGFAQIVAALRRTPSPKRTIIGCLADSRWTLKPVVGQSGSRLGMIACPAGKSEVIWRVGGGRWRLLVR
jgi:hypothetical protein